MGNTLSYFSKSSLRGWLLLGFLVLMLVLFFSLGLNHYLSFTTLKSNRHELITWANQHFWLAAFIFIISYTAAVAASIPGAVFFTLLGGFLFGNFAGTAFVVFSATLGATILFIAINSTSGKWLKQKAFTKVESMRQGFQKNAFNYLLILRFIPIFPFWLVNIGAALLDVPLKTFILATGLGIIPGSAVYVLLGSGLGYLFDQNKTPDLSIIFSPSIFLPLLGLAFLSLLPLLYQRFKKRAS